MASRLPCGISLNAPRSSPPGEIASPLKKSALSARRRCVIDHKRKPRSLPGARASRRARPARAPPLRQTTGRATARVAGIEVRRARQAGAERAVNLLHLPRGQARLGDLRGKFSPDCQRLNGAQRELVDQVRQWVVASPVGRRGEDDARPPHADARDDVGFELFQGLAVVGLIPVFDRLLGRRRRSPCRSGNRQAVAAALAPARTLASCAASAMSLLAARGLDVGARRAARRRPDSHRRPEGGSDEARAGFPRPGRRGRDSRIALAAAMDGHGGAAIGRGQNRSQVADGPAVIVVYEVKAVIGSGWPVLLTRQVRPPSAVCNTRVPGVPAIQQCGPRTSTADRSK